MPKHAGNVAGAGAGFAAARRAGGRARAAGAREAGVWGGEEEEEGGLPGAEAAPPLSAALASGTVARMSVGLGVRGVTEKRHREDRCL